MREMRAGDSWGRYEEKGGEETGVGDKYGIISGAKQRGAKRARVKMPRLDQESVAGNYLRLLAQRACSRLFDVASLVLPTSPSSFVLCPSSPSPGYLARVNVYLCIKQALFIRPMNMHCLVAVARCRVQTRRYHCLINHTQSQRPSLRVPPARAPRSVPCSHQPARERARRGLAVSSLGALHASPLVVYFSPSLGCPRYSWRPPPTSRN